MDAGCVKNGRKLDAFVAVGDVKFQMNLTPVTGEGTSLALTRMLQGKVRTSCIDASDIRRLHDGEVRGRRSPWSRTGCARGWRMLAKRSDRDD
jgi:hypothetical protein